MKKQVPLIIGMLAGLIAMAELYVKWHVVDEVSSLLLSFAQILLAAAFVLGGINIIQVNWPKIRRREPDWGYKVLLLGSAIFMAGVGVGWNAIGGERASGSVEIVAAASATAPPVIRVTTARPDAQVKVDAVASVGSGEFQVEPGPHTVSVSMALYGYGELKQDIDLAPGQIAEVRTDLVMLWGKEGRWFKWMYNHIFDPCNSTMFALLAFFIASAAFRAFRARNVEAALLLGSAIIIMLGRAPIGRAISDVLPAFSDWIVDVGNNSGRRAIMMGAALGAVATGLRVILGLERSHLGSE